MATTGAIWRVRSRSIRLPLHEYAAREHKRFLSSEARVALTKEPLEKSGQAGSLGGCDVVKVPIILPKVIQFGLFNMAIGESNINAARESLGDGITPRCLGGRLPPVSGNDATV